MISFLITFIGFNDVGKGKRIFNYFTSFLKAGDVDIWIYQKKKKGHFHKIQNEHIQYNHLIPRIGTCQLNDPFENEKCDVLKIAYEHMHSKTVTV